jgi:hypothetical protein
MVNLNIVGLDLASFAPLVYSVLEHTRQYSSTYYSSHLSCIPF